MKKRLIAVIVLIAVLVSMPVIYSFAKAEGTSAPEEFEAAADMLNGLGLFRGTESGYELDRVPTRAEAAVMLVRFLGKETEAGAMGDYSAPFTDVPDWAKMYVNYLYTNGITNGVSTTEFGSTQTCNAKMYSAFILRALGYADGVNFNYDTADETARERIYSNLTAGNFTRADMVALSTLALSAEVFEGAKTYTLAEKLADDGAIPANSTQIERAKQYHFVRGAFTRLAETRYYDISVKYTFSDDDYFVNSDELTARFRYDMRNGSPEWSYTNSLGGEQTYRDGYMSGDFGDDFTLDDMKLSFELDDELRFFNTFIYEYESGVHIYQLRYGANDFTAVAEDILGDEYTALAAQGLKINSIITEIAINDVGTLRYQNTMLRGVYFEDGADVLLNAYEEITVNAIE